LPIDRAGSSLAAELAADEALEREELRSRLLAAIATLPVAQREAFLLKHVDDLPYEEMAEILGVSVSALKMRVKRAREALQATLTGSASL
jgi:RNA polymerase sigma-70 factor (ECF subfamily)